jgi:hypothetical protein
VNFVGTIFNDYKCFRNFLMEENPGKLYFMFRASVFCNFYSVGCWKRCFQGYEYKKFFAAAPRKRRNCCTTPQLPYSADFAPSDFHFLSSLRRLRFVPLEASGVLKKFFSFKWNVEKWESCVVGNVAEQKLHNNILTIEHHRQFS